MSASTPHSELRRAMQTAAEYLEADGQGRKDEIASILREADGLFEQLEALGPDAARKVEAYDAARAQVKREGRSRAEYVLRAEHAEEQFDALRSAANAVVEAKGIYDIYDSTKAIRALRELLDSYPASSPKAGDLLWMTVPDGEQPPVGWTRNRPSDNRAWRIADGTEPAPARGRLPGPHPHDGYIQTVQVEPPRYFAVCCGCGSDMFPDRDTPEEAQADHHEHVEAVLRGSFQESRPEL